MNLLPRIRQIAINALDLDRATRFYRDSLGLTLLFNAGSMVFFDCGGTRLMLARPEKPEFDHPSSILYFDTADIREAARQLTDRGVNFIEQPQCAAKLEKVEVWIAFLRGSENNTMGLMIEVPSMDLKKHAA